MPTLEQFTEEVRAIVAENSQFKGTVKFSFPEGTVYVHANKEPAYVDHSNQEAECTIHLTLDTAYKILSGELSNFTAFALGKLKVQGDFAKAALIGQILNQTATKGKK
ncbi:MAG: SCP2 sterol-binding domain-containing protein [Cytophagales bacterium]|nr:SCP2 sterol-binding domain-containing protein [Bernardetiaceae bacterium]MDW8211493.1 SCP2 sterol-binding domain-containing protein [Cytophagales bacterium]